MSRNNISQVTPTFPRIPKGRGSGYNPPPRFARLQYEADPGGGEPNHSPSPTTLTTPITPTTIALHDHSRSIISFNHSPDLGYNASLNPYRGCEHGCSYCYARPYHEFLDLSAGLEFETKILVKTKAPVLLEKHLSSSNWKPQVINLSGVTDPYQPLERKYQLTRRCLEILLKFRNPVNIITKNALILRDIEILRRLAELKCVTVYISLNNLNAELSAKLEPRAASPSRRLHTIKKLHEAGIPVGIMTAPIIPALNDHELPQVLQAAAKAGARFASYAVIRLPGQVKNIFSVWLQTHFPQQKNKILRRISNLHIDPTDTHKFHRRFTGTSSYAQLIAQLFHKTCHRLHIATRSPSLNLAAFAKAIPHESEPIQGTLF